MNIGSSKILVFLFLLAVYSIDINAQSRPDILKSKAISLLDKGSYQESLNILEGLKEGTKDRDIYFLLGIAYQKTGRHRDAVKALKEFGVLNPGSEEYHYYLGVSLYELKRYQEAYAELTKAELAGVNIEESSYYVGYMYFINENYSEALPYFIKTIKQDGAHNDLAHYYAGICLYNKGFEDKTYFGSAIYHFDKVPKDNGELSQDARRYIEVIKEFLDEGTARYKKRMNLKSKADIVFTANRTVAPIEGIPVFGAQADKDSIAADFLFDIGFAPVLLEKFAIFVNYAFLIDTALSTQVDYTNVQKHKPGISFQLFNQLRTWETSLNYYYSLDFLDQDKVRRIDGAHVIQFSYDQSITSSWALGFKLPFRLYKGNGGAWGDFEGKGFEFAVSSYHMFGKTSILLEPSVIIYQSSNGVIPDFKLYSLNTKFNLPWRIWAFWPSIKLSPGRMSSSTVSRMTYDLGMNLGAPLGTGMKFNLVLRAREGFMSENWEVFGGIGFEYIY